MLTSCTARILRCPGTDKMLRMKEGSFTTAHEDADTVSALAESDLAGARWKQPVLLADAGLLFNGCRFSGTDSGGTGVR